MNRRQSATLIRPGAVRLLAKALLLFLVLMSGGNAFVSAQGPVAFQNWHRYTIIKGKFSLVMPGVPSVISRGQYHSAPPARDAQIYATYKDGVGYLVISFENPNHENSLDYFLEKQLRLAELRNCELGIRTDIRNAGPEQVQYALTKYDFGKTSSYPGVVKFYDLKNRVIALLAVGKDEGDQSVDMFLKSPDLTGTTTTTDVGAGATNTEELPKNSVPTVPGKEVSRKVMILLKPEPHYTEAARRKKLRGSVTLRAVLSASGKVVNIESVSGLPELVKGASDAARRIYFIPAMKDGQFVSVSMELQYNFNIY